MIKQIIKENKAEKQLEGFQYEYSNQPNQYEEYIKNYKNTIFKEIKNIIIKNDLEMKEKEQKVNDSLLVLQTQHKRLQFIEKRIQTYAQLVNSERISYIEKYKQLMRNK